MATELKPPMSLMSGPDTMMLLLKKKDKILSFPGFSLGFAFLSKLTYILGAPVLYICVKCALKRIFPSLQHYSRTQEHQSVNQHWMEKRTYPEFCISGCVQQKNCK